MQDDMQVSALAQFYLSAQTSKTFGKKEAQAICRRLLAREVFQIYYDHYHVLSIFVLQDCLREIQVLFQQCDQENSRARSIYQGLISSVSKGVMDIAWEKKTGSSGGKPNNTEVYVFIHIYVFITCVNL